MRSKPVDMSSDAISARLEEVRALYRLCVSLGEARLGGAAAPLAPAATEQEPGPGASPDRPPLTPRDVSE
ncbi:MAG: hypothetical protein HYZ53_15475 [Planctomycetes bacterium]|nr:hypothetical protein [Planctomycetota bacterium]